MNKLNNNMGLFKLTLWEKTLLKGNYTQPQHHVTSLASVSSSLLSPLESPWHIRNWLAAASKTPPVETASFQFPRSLGRYDVVVLKVKVDHPSGQANTAFCSLASPVQVGEKSRWTQTLGVHKTKSSMGWCPKNRVVLWGIDGFFGRHVTFQPILLFAEMTKLASCRRVFLAVS